MTRTARIAGEITIARPVEEVFDFVADARNEPRYDPELRRSDQVADGPIGVGTTYAALHRGRRGPFELTIEVTHYDRARLLGSTRSMPTREIRRTLTFESVTGGTRLRWACEIRPSGGSRLVGVLAGPARRQERAHWHGLKRCLEGAAHEGTAAGSGPSSPGPGSDASRGAPER